MHALYMCIKNNIHNHNETNSKTETVERQSDNVVGNNEYCIYNNDWFDGTKREITGVNEAMLL